MVIIVELGLIYQMAKRFRNLIVKTKRNSTAKVGRPLQLCDRKSIIARRIPSNYGSQFDNIDNYFCIYGL